MESADSQRRVPRGARPRATWLAALLGVAVTAALAVFGSVAMSRASAARRAEDAATSHVAAEARHIEVSETMLELLRREHTARTGAPPSAADEQALVREHVDREVLYREALALDLGHDDPIVKRRLTQKMEAVLDAAVPTAAPTDADIAEWFWTHRDRYERPARVSFTHVFFRRERLDGDLETVSRGALAALERGDDPGSMGEPFVRGTHFQAKSRDELAAIFGPDFAEQVMGAPEGKWAGPMASSFGWHLVRIEAREGAKLPEIDEVRAGIVDEISGERRARARRETLDRLRARYQVVTPIARSEPAP